MAIVLDLGADGAINSYSALVAELRDLQDNDAYSGDAIDRAIRKAEAYFARKLRLANMEVSATLAVSAAATALPTDCREIRSVVWLGGSEEYTLNRMTLQALADAYGGVSAAYPYAYAQEGATLRFGPVCSGTARLVYYADLTPLTEGSPTNWLLLQAPDLYVSGAQYYLCRRERDDAGAQAALGEADRLLASLIEEGARMAGGSLVPYAIAQVTGSRV